ncbi:hypothetical protein AX17_006662 [Amanita inopinata Kibby_2008]|nr:hypothetical protein AX17_006662 [Amanita inopinata Kibby_2008]
MSDQTPPRPKPGSLRDRIAAFETAKSAKNPLGPTPPAPRPKPGGLQWKPRASSPPPSSTSDNPTGSASISPGATGVADGSKKIGAGMSASDARDSIRQGASLKERMAALQGKGAFGQQQSPAPASSERPKWKPPPVVPVVPAIGEEEGKKSVDDTDESQQAVDVATKSPSQTASSDAETGREAEGVEPVQNAVEGQQLTATEGDEGQAEVDPEEEERQRRAAIAARMARLGGARVGMTGPPVFGMKPAVPPPTVKKAEVPKEPKEKEEEGEEEIKPQEAVTQSTTPSTSIEPTSEAQTMDSQAIEIASASIPSTTEPAPEAVVTSESPIQTSRIPASMPVPAVPRRAGPPRRKVPKPPVEAEETPEEAPTEVEPSEAGLLESTESLTKEETAADLEAEQVQIYEAEVPAPVLIDTVSVKAEEVQPRLEEEIETLKKSGAIEDPDAEPEPEHAPVMVKEEEEEPVLHEEPMATGEAEVKEEEVQEEQEEVQDKPGQEEEQVENAETRRKKIAERLAKMGGINPFAPQSQLPKRTLSRDYEGEEPTVVSPKSPSFVSNIASGGVGPVGRTSVDSVGSIKSAGGSIGRRGTFGQSQEPPARTSIDSVKSFESATRRESLGRSSAGIPEQNEQIEEEMKEKERTEDDVALTVSAMATASAHNDDVKIAHPLVEEFGGAESKAKQKEPERTEQYRRRLSEDVDQGDEVKDTQTPPELDRSTRSPPPQGPTRSSGFVTRQNESDEGEKEEEEFEEEEGNEDEPRVSPPPLPVSPRVAQAESASLESHIGSGEVSEQGEDEEEALRVPPRRFSAADERDEEGHRSRPESDNESAAPLPIPHRPSLVSSSAIRPVLRKPSGDEYEDKVKHVPPPTRHVPPPPVPVSPENEDMEESEHQLAEGETPLFVPPPEKRAPENKSEGKPLPHPILVRLPAPTKEAEVMDEDEGDPIDPGFHTPIRPSFTIPAYATPSREVPVHEAEDKDKAPTQTQDELSTVDLEAARRRTIAERMAKLGGIKFGAAPLPMPTSRLPPPPPREPRELEEEHGEKEEKEEKEETKEVDEEEEERARKERIAAKLAGMGGMRIGMVPPMMGIPTRPPQRPVQKSEEHKANMPSTSVLPAAPPARAPPARAPPLTQLTRDVESEQESASNSEDGVKVEMEESEIEEVRHEDAQMDDEDVEEVPSPPAPHRVAPPPPPPVSAQPELPKSPTQRTRPPVPSTTHIRKSSGQSLTGRKTSTGSTTGTFRPRRPSDYVMVDEPANVTGSGTVAEDDEAVEIAPPPPARPAHRGPPSRGAPPAPSSAALSDSISSQWELPAIPSGGLDITGVTGSDLSLSWSEAEDTLSSSTPSATTTTTGAAAHVPSHPPPPAPPVQTKSAASMMGHRRLTSDALMSVWGRVGVQICEIATSLHEKSKKSLVGDGTYAGFVQAVLSEVPNAVKPAILDAPSASTQEGTWGYLIYSQTGAAVQRRVSDIMPGDVIELRDAKLKGHKGLQTYTQHVGTDEVLVGVVSEVEPKKSKVRVLQANQHVGQQTVESASYRLEDLKSGTIKVYRVLEVE